MGCYVFVHLINIFNFITNVNVCRNIESIIYSYEVYFYYLNAYLNFASYESGKYQKSDFFVKKLTFSILTTVPNGITTFETCLSKEREARFIEGNFEARWGVSVRSCNVCRSMVAAFHVVFGCTCGAASTTLQITKERIKHVLKT